MICFALLAHKDEDALRKQIGNIRNYNKNAFIVLFNGGSDPEFGKAVSAEGLVLLCPYSRPLRPGRTGRFFLDVMTWLENVNIPYEYLVYTEYDVMFINNGFEQLLQELMKGHDCLVEAVKTEKTPHCSEWSTALGMWKEWELWKPFFRSDHFYGTFNPMQVYRHELVTRMLKSIDRPLLEDILQKTDVFALGEMLYMTLAMRCGAKPREYPSLNRRCFRYRPQITLSEIKQAKQKPEVIFVHPVKDKKVRDWIIAE